MIIRQYCHVAGWTSQIFTVIRQASHHSYAKPAERCTLCGAILMENSKSNAAIVQEHKECLGEPKLVPYFAIISLMSDLAKFGLYTCGRISGWQALSASNPLVPPAYDKRHREGISM